MLFSIPENTSKNMFAYFLNSVNIFLIKYMNFISCQGRTNAILNENFVILKNLLRDAPQAVPFFKQIKSARVAQQFEFLNIKFCEANLLRAIKPAYICHENVHNVAARIMDNRIIQQWENIHSAKRLFLTILNHS